jgi:hypothetical protein
MMYKFTFDVFAVAVVAVDEVMKRDDVRPRHAVILTETSSQVAIRMVRSSVTWLLMC